MSVQHCSALALNKLMIWGARWTRIDGNLRDIVEKWRASVAR